jgi:hypothetical protein
MQKDFNGRGLEGHGRVVGMGKFVENWSIQD